MRYPALDVSNVDFDLAIAVAGDYSLAAAQEHATFLTLYFPDSVTRFGAREALARAFPDARISSRDVDDEDWARRSQQNIPAVTVGRLRVSPPWAVHGGNHVEPGPPEIIIEPSTGFGTGHHATTRLCLTAMQAMDLSGATVLDIGTGSGILALAAGLLGAARVIAIDHDSDAIRNASDNLRLNAGIDNVTFECLDLETLAGRHPNEPVADVILANLTGALLAREAGTIVRLTRPRGRLVVSGLQCQEQDDVVEAFRDTGHCEVTWHEQEDGWTGLVLRREQIGPAQPTDGP